MHAALVVVLVVIGFAYFSPPSRKVLLAGGVLVAVAIAYFIQDNIHRTEQQDRATEVARRQAATAITLNDLKFTNVLLKLDFRDSWTFDGVVSNNSQHHLKHVVFKLTVKDCEDQLGREYCRIVGENFTITTPDAPAGQTRAFHGLRVDFKNMPKEVLRQCQKTPCGVTTRTVEWEAIGIEARLAKDL